MVAEGGEGENPLPFSLTAPKRAGGGVGGFCGEKAPDPWWAGPQALGARAPSLLETWPTGPWGLDPATLTGLKTPKHSGGALQSHEKAGFLFAPAFQPLRRAPLKTWPTSPCALHPGVKNSKNAPVLIGS